MEVRYRDAKSHRKIKSKNFFLELNSITITIQMLFDFPSALECPSNLDICTIPNHYNTSKSVTRKPRYEFLKIEFKLKKSKMKQFQIMEFFYVSAQLVTGINMTLKKIDWPFHTTFARITYENVQQLVCILNLLYSDNGANVDSCGICFKYILTLGERIKILVFVYSNRL